jgi:hypothetical protein
MASMPPKGKRAGEKGALVLTLVMWGCAALLGLIGAGGYPLMSLAAVFLALLALPVLQNTARSPDIVLREDGLLLRPAVWRERLVPWADIAAVKDDPSLPPEGAEVYRRRAVGKAKYRPAAGRLLVLKRMPPQYRLAGFFAGEGLHAVISVNTRSHPDYDRLMAAIEKRVTPPPAG